MSVIELSIKKKEMVGQLVSATVEIVSTLTGILIDTWIPEVGLFIE